MEKELVRKLLNSWYAAQRACVWERSSDIDRDMKKVRDEYSEWERQFGLEPTTWDEGD